MFASPTGTQIYICFFIYIDKERMIARLIKRNKFLTQEAEREEQYQKLLAENKAITERLRRLGKKVA